MSPMDDSALDRSIDEAARQMTAGEPSPYLRARVLARLDDRPRWRAAWIVAPMALGAAVVLALAVSYRSTPVRPEAPAPAVVASRGTAATAVEAAPASGTVAPSTTAPAGETRQPSARGTAADRPSEIDALAPSELDVPSIALTEMDPAESIQLPPLDVIAPIAVQAIGEPEGEKP